MVSKLLRELQQEQYMVVATRNVPNNVFDQVNWHTLDDLATKMEQLHAIENYEALNLVDMKSKKLN